MRIITIKEDGRRLEYIGVINLIVKDNMASFFWGRKVTPVTLYIPNYVSVDIRP